MIREEGEGEEGGAKGRGRRWEEEEKREGRVSV